MKSKFLLAMSAGLLFCSLKQKAQVSSYSFSQTMSTYGAPNTGSLVGIPLQDDDVTTVALPFPFTFNGTSQTSVNVCSNGYLSFNTISGTVYSAISNATTQDVISVLGDDLWMGSMAYVDLTSGSNTLVAVGAVPGFSVGDVLEDMYGDFATNPTITAISGNTIEVNQNALGTAVGVDIYSKNGYIKQDVSGTAPNRVCEFEFVNFTRYDLTEAINFKVRLYETSNNIEFVYGDITPASFLTFPEVGLKGLSLTDYNSRLVIAPQTWLISSAATTVSDYCEFDLGSVPASGLSYLWSPPSCTVPVLAISSSSANICPGESVELTASGATTYSWTNGPTTAQYTVTPSATTEYTLVGANGTCTSSITHTQQVTPAPVLAVTSASASICPGEAVELTASGATTYSWTNGPTTAQYTVTPSATTEYTLVGANGTCTSSITHTQQVTPAPVLAVTSASASICPGEAVELTASGATTYSWTNGPTTAQYTVTPSATTEYTLVGANGTCTSSVTFTQQVTPVPALSISQSAALICAGQSATLTASGATSYSWTNGPTTAQYSITPDATTEYTLVGANGTCTSSITFTQQVAVTPTITISQSSTVICAGQSVTLTASGATTYSWNGVAAASQTVVTPASVTLYSVTGSNGTCTASQTITQNVNAVPSLTFAQTSTLICAGQSVTLTASGATSYSLDGVTSTPQIVVSPTTTTTYVLLGSNGTCTSTASLVQNVEECNVTGIQEAAGNSASAVLAYPNPFSTALNVQNTAEKDMDVIIADALGKIIFKATVKAQSTETISAESLNAGLYFISVNGTTKKLIKQ